MADITNLRFLAIFVGGMFPERVNVLHSADWGTKSWRSPAQSTARWMGKWRNTMTGTAVAFPNQALGKNVLRTVAREDGAILLGQR